ncbi:phosphotransferase [Spirosoma aerophilum]
MKNHVYEEDIQRLTTGLNRIGLPVAANASADYSCSISCNLYRNPDGTIRWLWPVGAAQPDFLRFYYVGSRRAQLFSWFVRFIFFLKQGNRLAQGQLTLYTTVDGQQRLLGAEIARWALFTGTAGPNRKLVVWYVTHDSKRYFLKIALGPAAVNNLRQEALALQHLQEQPFLQLESPRLNAYYSGVVIQEDMGNGAGKQANRLTDLPSGALLELVSRNWHRQPLAQTVCWQQALGTLTALRTMPDTRIPIGLLDKLDRLMQSLDADVVVPMAAAHGDFTPWNMLLRNQQLGVFDWELAQPVLPGLYDLFHFQYQSGTLIGNQGFGVVRQEIQTMLNCPEWQLFCERHRIDADLAEILYLVQTMTYYLSVYSRQSAWHPQVNWLLTTWNEALTYWLSLRNIMSDRQLLLQDVAFWLHEKPHAALKFLPAQLDDLPDSSDLDLCLPRAVARQLTAFVRQHRLVHHVVVETRSFMNQLHIHCLDDSSLHIDLIWSFKRKQLEFMDAHEVWEGAALGAHGLKVPRREADQTYIRLFYGLNKAVIPERYYHVFDQPAPVMASDKLVNEVRQLPPNRGWRGVVNTLLYGWDTIRSLAFQRGMVVTFSGVDGAGKSTVIEQTKYQIEKRLRQRVIVLRHRPSVLPILSAWQYGKQQAEQRSIQTLPRQGTNQSQLSSLLRFAYYYTDYLFGQFYIQVKYVWRGYIVLYDRYYFDFINDSRRSNLQLPAGLATRLYRLLLKPRLNVFLYASPEEILRRKQELDAGTITELTGQYLQLFDRLQTQYPDSEYMPVLNQDLPLTLNRIFNRIEVHSVY